METLVRTVELIAPIFGGINLEDICAPRCFEIEKRLTEKLDIPVFHDDQHGTAIVVLAGLYNALKVVKKKIDKIKVVINGAGAAGIAVTNILLEAGVKDVVMLDSRGTIFAGRKNLNEIKKEMAKKTNKKKIDADLESVMQGSDVFIGLSKPDLVSREMVKSMSNKAIVFAMSNPNPEIMPDEAQVRDSLVKMCPDTAIIPHYYHTEVFNRLISLMVFQICYSAAEKSDVRVFTGIDGFSKGIDALFYLCLIFLNVVSFPRALFFFAICSFRSSPRIWLFVPPRVQI